MRKARSASKSGAAAYPLSLATIVVLAAVALTVRAGIDLNFENCAPLIAGAVLFGGVIFAVLWRVDAQLRCDFNPCVTIAIFALAYSHGPLAFADVKLDASSGHDTQTAEADISRFPDDVHFAPESGHQLEVVGISALCQPREFASGTAATLKTCIPGQDQLESSVSARDAQGVATFKFE